MSFPDRRDPRAPPRPPAPRGQPSPGGSRGRALPLLLLLLLCAPRAARAELPLKISFYGFLNGEVEWVRALGGATPYTSRMRVSDGNSRLGLTGAYEILPGTRAIVQLEGFLNSFEQGGVDDLGHAATLESRNSFIGVDDERFGRVVLGYYDSAYRSLVGTGNNFGGNNGLTGQGLDLWNNTTAAVSGGFTSLFGRGESRFKNSLHYLSPVLFGARVAASYGFDETLASGGRRDHASAALLYEFAGLRAGLGYDHQANTGVDTDRLLGGLGMQTAGVNDVDTAFYKVIVSYNFPTGTYLGFGYERSVYGFANFAKPQPPTVYTPLASGKLSQGGAMISAAQALGDLTLMASIGKLGNLSNSIVGPGSDYASSQISLGAKYAFNASFMVYAYFTRIDNKPLQNLTLGSPIFSNAAGTDGAFLAPGNKPTAGGTGMIARF